MNKYHFFNQLNAYLIFMASMGLQILNSCRNTNFEYQIVVKVDSKSRFQPKFGNNPFKLKYQKAANLNVS